MSDVINGVPRELLERVCARPWSHSENHKLAMMELSALLTAQPQASAAQSAALVQMPDVDDLANFIRFTDGNHKMGSGALAERIVDWLSAPSAAQSAPAGAGPDGLPLVIAGAIFDFAGFLTTREGVIEVGATANASPVADLIQEWAELRGLSLADAAVLSWQDLLVAWQRTQSAPAGGREVLERELLSVLDFSDSNLRRVVDHLLDAGYSRAAWQRTQSAGAPEGWRLVGYTTAGMLAIAEQLPLTGRIGARCKADERWNVPLYAHTNAPALADESWLAYTDPEASAEENTVRQVSALVAGKAFNEVCRMLGGRWPDAKLEQEAPTAHRFFMELIGAAPAQPAAQAACGCLGTEQCGAFYDYNAQRMSCRAMRDGACPGPAAQDQGEVQKLREALERIADDYIPASQEEAAVALEEMRNELKLVLAETALAASTGQEV